MEKLFRLILEMGITAVPVILAVFAIRMCLLRAPKRYSYLLWGIAGFRLAVPFSVSSALSIFNLGFFRGTSIGRNIAQPGMGEAFGAQPAGLGQGLAGAGALQTAPALQGRASATDGIWQVLMFLWALGVVALLGYFLLSWIQMRRRVEKAVWMQENVWECENIPSPFVMGIFSPKIYIPFRLGGAERMVILSHEQYHIQRRDYLVKIFAYLLLVVYWFHPLVWYALKEMKNDREVACDTTVLKQIGKEAYIDYGNTLINFAEKMSHTPFPFAAGISGNMKQMQKRIKNIASYYPASFQKKLQSTVTFIIIAFFLSGTVPILSIQALEKSRYHFDETNVSYLDLHNIFEGYEGSFVLYDSKEDAWQIYNKENAITRIPPASTFKIYSALYGLESGTITPEQSLIRWNGQNYVYDLWNADQTLESAMQNSVTWYFQTLDQFANLSDIEKYVQEIGYGNQIVVGDITSYWLNSSLKISPVEQVQLLKKLYNNQFEFAHKNIEAVKNALSLYTTDEGTLSGKTGTQEINGQNTSGWFIGYIEKNDRTYFFATNIQSDQFASGPVATELTFTILSDLGLWNND